MIFKVVDSAYTLPVEDAVFLMRTGWNDWYTWYTKFQVIVVRQGHPATSLGSVKIARKGMTRQTATTPLPDEFSALDESYFSIGQSENYYETLNGLGDEFRLRLLTALRDGAQNLSILDDNADEEVLGESLLRDIDRGRVRNRFNRLANGNPVLTPFAFKYAFPVDPKATTPPPVLDFRVQPLGKPPSNVHVLIGRNGVGKSRCFDFLTRSFLKISGPKGEAVGELASIRTDILDDDHGFAGLVTVSFSPFDKYGPLVKNAGQLRQRYDYVGLIKETEHEVKAAAAAADDQPLPPAPSIKSHANLTDDFVASVKTCREGARRTRWQKALQMLEADPLFEAINVAAFAAEEATNWEAIARERFGRLSSGHSVVLLTITRLVELVEEASLVLIDEPECHLHPPLLSAFVRALSDLLINRNGVAIVATHSPVVLQEVPRSCAWVLNRTGHEIRIDRPELECFGENVGILTREVFGLEVVQTGFHRMVAEGAAGRTFDEVNAFFGHQLGAEARSLARVLTLLPDDDGAIDDGTTESAN